MASLQLLLDIVARDNASKEFRNVGEAVDDVGGKAGKAGGIFSKLGPAVAAGAAIAGVAVAGFGLSAIGAASDLEQTRIKIGNVFGPESSKTVEAFASNAASSLGISSASALDASATFGTFFTQLGFTQEQSALTSGEVIKLAADLGSFNNLPTAEVLDAINSSLRGEFDSLQRLVPTINAAAVEQRALADSGKTVVGSLTEQEKATATLALISEGGALALNDFAESSDTLAIRQQILKAKFDDAKDALGTALLPAATAVAGFFTDKFVPAVEKLVTEFKNGTGRGGELREQFDKVKQGIIDNLPQIKAFGEKMLEVGGFIVKTVIPALITVYRTSMPALETAFFLVKDAIEVTQDFFFGFVKALLGGFEAVFTVLGKVPGPFQENFKQAAAAVKGAGIVVDGIKAQIDNALKPKTLDVKADTAAAASDIDSIGARVARLRDKTITITTTEVQRFIVEGQRAAGRGLQERAEGGPVRAGVPYLVGERGPELIVPPRNGFVLTASQTASAMAPSTGGAVGGGDMSALLAAVNGLRSDVQRQARQFQQLDRQMAGV